MFHDDKNNGNNNEVILWKNVSTKGFFHKRVVLALELTNFSVIINNTRVPLSEIDNVVVINQYSYSSGSHYTIGLGSYYTRSNMT
jgi:hypothetical protein